MDDKSCQCGPYGFGRYLQQLRLERRIPLGAVSAATRISVEVLMRLESGDLHHLPAPVYVKGFLRAYAGVVGADPEEAVARYLAELEASRLSERRSLELYRSGRRFWRRLIAILLALLLLIAATVLYYERGRRSRNEPPLSPAAGESIATEKRVPRSEPAAAAGSRLLLRIDALKPTRIKVIIDDRASTEYDLNGGDRLELEAASNYNILIDNAAAVEMTLNGMPYPLHGKSGQAAAVIIP